MPEYMTQDATMKGDGRIKPGEARNPGGLSKEEREARDCVRKALSSTLRLKGLAAYERLLDADNPLIVRDFMDRVAGKVKEQVELSQDPDNPVNALTAFGPEDLAAFALWRIEKRKEGK